jgi:DNA-binding transcriptional ArsR family regulator
VTQDEAETLASFLKLLANPNRLAIIALLRRGPRTVADIEAVLAIRQPSLSQQLGVLREGGLINAERTAKSVAYALAEEALQPALELLFDRLQVAGDHIADIQPERQRGARPSQAAIFAEITRTS